MPGMGVLTQELYFGTHPWESTLGLGRDTTIKIY